MLFGGTLLDTPEKLAEAEAQGPEHVAKCATCSRAFYRSSPKTDVCYDCWYRMSMDDAESRFKPLADELESRLEVKTHVEQTGGMVMCLTVPIGSGDDERHAWFSELDEFCCAGVGLYVSYDDEGVYHENPDLTSSAAAWRDDPEHCARVADWAAPIIVAFAVETGL